MDGHRQRVGNFKIEPPGLFRGRGDHPKQGKFKKRTMPEDVIINIGKYVSMLLSAKACSPLKIYEREDKIIYLERLSEMGFSGLSKISEYL